MLTDRVMSLEVGRAGGGMIHNILSDIPGLTIIDNGIHGTYDFYAGQCQRLGIMAPPALTFIRNPWQWYVSQWCWIRHVQRPEFPFQGTFREAMETTKKDPSFWYLRSLTWSWHRHQADKAQYVGRMEALEDETVRILLAIIPDLLIEDEVRARVRADWTGRTRCPNGEYEDRFLDYHKYYDAELRGWVAEWDAELIERFQYKF